MSEPHCEFCEADALWIHIPTYGPVNYGCRLSCHAHRRKVRRLIYLDLGHGFTREVRGCVECFGPVPVDRLPPAYANPICHKCLPPPEPLPIARVEVEP